MSFFRKKPPVPAPVDPMRLRHFHIELCQRYGEPVADALLQAGKEDPAALMEKLGDKGSKECFNLTLRLGVVGEVNTVQALGERGLALLASNPMVDPAAGRDRGR